MRVGMLQPQDLADHVLFQPLGMAMRPATQLAHTPKAMTHKTFPPLVAGLPADPVLPAQLTEVRVVQRFHHKLNPLVHY
jgi:hypothetical protein